METCSQRATSLVAQLSLKRPHVYVCTGTHYLCSKYICVMVTSYICVIRAYSGQYKCAHEYAENTVLRYLSLTPPHGSCRNSCSSRQAVFSVHRRHSKTACATYRLRDGTRLPCGFVPPTDPTAESSPAEFTDVGTVFLVGEGEAPLNNSRRCVN